VPRRESADPDWVPLRDLMPHYWLQAFDDVPKMWSDTRPAV
jgi:hypothetical protein